jgi:hypothetical protein
MPGEKREPYNPLLKSYPDSERVNCVSEGAETLFTRLIAQSDDANHYYGEPAMVLGKLYTRRMCAGQVTLKMVRDRIGELENARLIETYEVEGRLYIEIVNCRKDLRSDVKPDIRFPARPSGTHGPNPARIRPESGSSTQPNPTQPNPITPSASADWFDRFWAAWPKHFRKQGKSDCRTIWKRRKLEAVGERVVECVIAFKASKEWKKDDQQYIPFPKTWLNRTPWESDLLDISGKSSVIQNVQQIEAERRAQAEKMRVRSAAEAERKSRIEFVRSVPEVERLRLRAEYAAKQPSDVARTAMAKADPLAGGPLTDLIYGHIKANEMAGAA